MSCGQSGGGSRSLGPSPPPGHRALWFRGVSLPFPPSSPTLGFMELSSVATGDRPGCWGGSLESGAKERGVGKVDSRQHVRLEETDGSSLLFQNFPSTPPLGCGESGGIRRPASVCRAVTGGTGELWASAISALCLSGPSRSTVLLRLPASSVWARARERRELKVRTEAALLIL